MTKLQRLTEEIRNLSSGELAVLRAWFEDFDSVDSSRRIDDYLPPAGAAEIVDKSCEEDKPGNERARALELAACMREAYRQVAFQEYAQCVAKDLGFCDTVGPSLT